MKRDFGIAGHEYANRNGSDIRYYVDIDDRVAADVVGLKNAAQNPADGDTQSRSSTQVTRPRRKL